MQKKIILLIGGPGTGKSTLIETLSKRGYVCYPEISRQVTLEAQQQGTDQLFLEDPLLFSQKLLEGRIKQYQEALAEEEDIVFIDRGIPDVVAYMHFIGDNEYPNSFTHACKQHRYSQLFILPVWNEIYLTDNERYESLEEAEKIQEHLVQTYTDFGYDMTEVPRDTPENRADFILERLGV
ncbi:MAG TPA: ATP-binding protein [Flavobacterium sp.]|nr:ATP-binding protein [Flavobacterium sp.]